VRIAALVSFHPTAVKVRKSVQSEISYLTSDGTQMHIHCNLHNKHSVGNSLNELSVSDASQVIKESGTMSFKCAKISPRSWPMTALKISHRARHRLSIHDLIRL
jgi:hypothetical protein